RGGRVGGRSSRRPAAAGGPAAWRRGCRPEGAGGRRAAGWRGEEQSFSPPYDSGLPRLDEEVGAAVLGPARFRVLGALRALFPVADDGDAIRLHALRDEIVHRRLRTPFTERQVVFVRAPLVAMTLHWHG